MKFNLKHKLNTLLHEDNLLHTTMKIFAYVTDKAFTKDEFNIECNSIEELYKALCDAKNEGLNHIHIEFCDRSNSSNKVGEVTVPFEKGITPVTRLYS